MFQRRITLIPIPGGSGRIPTGAMQFQDDWPGLFVRGDDCMRLAGWLRELRNDLGTDAFARTGLSGLLEAIERDVIVSQSGRGGPRDVE